MKKMVAMMMGLTLCGSLLAGCGNQDDKTADSTSKSSASTDSTSVDSTSKGEDTQQDAAADGVKSEEAFTLRIVCSGETDDGIDIAMDMYKEMYPNATVEPITVTWGAGGADMREKELIMLQSGDVPDIGKMVWMKEFAREGLLVDITDGVKEMPIYQNLSEGQLARMTYEDKIYGMTFGNNSVFMFYNKDILEAAGWENPPATMEEVTQLAKDIKEKGLKTADGKDIYLTAFEGGNWSTDYWLWANGGVQMNDDYTKTMIDSPESVAAYQYMQDLVKDGSVPKIDGTGNQLWLNGQAAIWMSGEWDVPATDDAGFNYGVTTTPVGADGENPVSIGGVEWGVFEGSEHAEEALDFISIFVSDEFAAKFGRGLTDLTQYDNPDFQAVWKESGLYDAKMIQREQLKNTKYNFLEAPYVFQEASSIYSDALEKILVRLDPVEDTMKAAAEQINAGIAADSE